MSLNWNIENVKDYKELTDSDDESVVTQVIVFGTMGVGIGEITEKTAEEFFIRLRIWENLFGPSLIMNGEPTKITFAQVQRRIGLTTNVSFESKPNWNTKVARWVRETAVEQMYSEIHKAERDAAAV